MDVGCIWIISVLLTFLQTVTSGLLWICTQRTCHLSITTHPYWCNIISAIYCLLPLIHNDATFSILVIVSRHSTILMQHSKCHWLSLTTHPYWWKHFQCHYLSVTPILIDAPFPIQSRYLGLLDKTSPHPQLTLCSAVCIFGLEAVCHIARIFLENNKNICLLLELNTNIFMRLRFEKRGLWEMAILWMLICKLGNK